jgi:hypothetical protein
MRLPLEALLMFIINQYLMPDKLCIVVGFMKLYQIKPPEMGFVV